MKAIVFFAAAFVSAGGGVIAEAAEFVPLGDLPGGAFRSEAREISGDGRVVVGSSDTDRGTESFRWTRETGMESIGRFPGPDNFAAVANAASFDGSVIVGSGDTLASPGTGTEGESYRWTAASGLVGLGDLPGGEIQGRPSDVSADGSVVVGWSVAEFGFADFGRRAYRWDGVSGLEALPELPDGNGGVANSVASAVTADGSTIFGGYRGAHERLRAFVWDEAGGIRDLPDVDEDILEITISKINPEGTLGVGFGGRAEFGNFSPLVWRAGEGVTILDPEATMLIEAMNPDASIVVGEDFGGPLGAVVWTEETGVIALEVFLTALGLDVSGWDFRTVGGFSDDGRSLVGGGVNPQGEFEAFLVVIPEPGTALLLGLGLTALTALARRGRLKA